MVASAQYPILWRYSKAMLYHQINSNDESSSDYDDEEYDDFDEESVQVKVIHSPPNLNQSADMEQQQRRAQSASETSMLAKLLKWDFEKELIKS